MAVREAKFSATGGPLEIEIRIEKNKTGRVNFFLLDRHDEHLDHGAGNLTVNTFKINPNLTAEQLNGASLLWDAKIHGPDKPNQIWQIIIIIRQDGERIEDGIIEFPDPDGEDSNTFQSRIFVTGEVRLRRK
jgi:hypothetical protein